MKELRTEIMINASPEKVWKILTDFEKYPKWNPFIYRVAGTAEKNEKVDITFRNGLKEMTLHCLVTNAKPSKELCWKYHYILPFLFRGEHCFIIEESAKDKVRFIDREQFNGLLVFTQAKDIDTNSKHDFEAMDLALKKLAEKSK